MQNTGLREWQRDADARTRRTLRGISLCGGMRVVAARCRDGTHAAQEGHCDGLHISSAKARQQRMTPVRACDEQSGGADGPVRCQRAHACQHGRQRAVQGGRKERAGAEQRVDAVQVRPRALAMLLRNERVGGDADLRVA